MVSSRYNQATPSIVDLAKFITLLLFLPLVEKHNGDLTLFSSMSDAALDKTNSALSSILYILLHSHFRTDIHSTEQFANNA